MKYRTLKFLVEITSVGTIAATKNYIEDAVGSWRGSLRPPGADGDESDPGDPMWFTELKKVTRIKP